MDELRLAFDVIVTARIGILPPVELGVIPGDAPEPARSLADLLITTGMDINRSLDQRGKPVAWCEGYTSVCTPRDDQH